MRALQKIHPELEVRHGMGSSTYEVESEHAIHCHITRAGHWIAMRRTSMHYNEDILVARKSLRNAGRKQENPIVFVCLPGWNKMACQRSPQCRDKKKTHLTVQPFMSPALDTSTTPDLRPCGCLASEPCACEVQFPTTPPDTQHEHRDREREGPDTSKRVSRAGGSFGVGGRREAEEAKKSLDASKSKNDCNAEERSSGAVASDRRPCKIYQAL